MKQTYALLRLFRTLIDKIRQQPDAYPVKYYKKGQRTRRMSQRSGDYA